MLRAVSELIVEGKLDRHKLNLRFVGSSQFAGGRSITEMIAENNLDGVVEIVGFVPRKDALKEILRANVLLLVGTQNLTVAAKTYEYMAARKPILAIVEEGAEADLIRHSGAGVVVSPDDLDGVKRAITYWYQESLKEDGLGFQQSPYGLDRTHDYSWEILGARYSSVLEDCLGVI